MSFSDGVVGAELAHQLSLAQDRSLSIHTAAGCIKNIMLLELELLNIRESNHDSFWAILLSPTLMLTP